MYVVSLKQMNKSYLNCRKNELKCMYEHLQLKFFLGLYPGSPLLGEGPLRGVGKGWRTGKGREWRGCREKGRGRREKGEKGVGRAR
jgi:hypothetical protein